MKRIAYGRTRRQDGPLHIVSPHYKDAIPGLSYSAVCGVIVGGEGFSVSRPEERICRKCDRRAEKGVREP